MTCELHTQTWSSCKACFANAHEPTADTVRDFATFVQQLDCGNCGYRHSSETACPKSELDAVRMQAQAIRDAYNSPVKFGEPLQGTQEASGPPFCDEPGCDHLADSLCPYCTYHRTPRQPSNPAPAATRPGTWKCPTCHVTFAGWDTAGDGTSLQHLRECALMNAPAPQPGWMCPRCHTVHAPFVRACECRP